MSKNDATQKRTPAEKKAKADKNAARLVEKLSAAQQNSLDANAVQDVTSDSTSTPVASGDPAPAPAPETPASRRPMKMETLELTISTAPRKSKRLVIYNITGRTGSVQFLSTLFGGSQTELGAPPATLQLTGEFAAQKAKAEPKPKETPEERKARLAAMPKLTLAEKVAKAEEHARVLREKLAAKQAKQEAPVAEAVPA